MKERRNAFTLAERINSSACAGETSCRIALTAGEASSCFLSPLAGETSLHYPSPLAKFRTADKPVSESRNHGSGSEVMTGASAKEFQDAGEGLGVRGSKKFALAVQTALSYKFAPAGERARSAKGGFTLAEVLITLVIIGVIGALTVPALIQNTQKQEYVSALKKAYSTLSQVTQQIIAEEGSPSASGSWSENLDSLYSAYKKRLSNIKEGETSSKCFTKTYNEVYSNARTIDLNWNNSGNFRCVTLADGMIIAFSNAGTNCPADGAGRCGWLWVDVNGAKGPNTLGRDFFDFEIKENRLAPMGCNGDWRTNSHALTCKVITEGAMNY